MNNDNILPKGTETVLIVDDQETIWDYLIEALQTLGYTVLLAENGQDAVDIYQNNPNEIDLILLDMIMPVLNGHDAFIEIQKIDPDVCVLLSSGYVSEEEVQDLIKLGASGFLNKPHRLPVVAQAIRKVLDERAVKKV
ncbi:response regulator [Lentisphaerota bacterium WC36G]|nr:response regulator [Lentisphaerae bacterium WC36]